MTEPFFRQPRLLSLTHTPPPPTLTQPSSTRRLSATGIKIPASVHLTATTRSASAPSATPAPAFLPLSLSATTVRTASPLTDACCRFLEASASVADGVRLRVASVRAVVAAAAATLSAVAASVSSSLTTLVHRLATSSVAVPASLIQCVRSRYARGVVAKARAARRTDAAATAASCSHLDGVSLLFESAEGCAETAAVEVTTASCLIDVGRLFAAAEVRADHDRDRASVAGAAFNTAPWNYTDALNRVFMLPLSDAVFATRVARRSRNAAAKDAAKARRAANVVADAAAAAARSNAVAMRYEAATAAEVALENSTVRPGMKVEARLVARAGYDAALAAGGDAVAARAAAVDAIVQLNAGLILPLNVSAVRPVVLRKPQRVVVEKPVEAVAVVAAPVAALPRRVFPLALPAPPVRLLLPAPPVRLLLTEPPIILEALPEPVPVYAGCAPAPRNAEEAAPTSSEFWAEFAARARADAAHADRASLIDAGAAKIGARGHRHDVAAALAATGAEAAFVASL